MSYVAEPYSHFVDDLLSALTGGLVRERFVFRPDAGPYTLETPAPILPSTVRAVGQAGQAFHRFRGGVDFDLVDDAIVWRADSAAVRPDEGTAFFVAFEVEPGVGAAPRLTDRQPGSIVRTLAESFAREYAVLSGQLEEVYRAGFVDTAAGRDLDQLGLLVGVDRRERDVAAGIVVFSRSTPAPAEIHIAAGTRLSTHEPPAVVFETRAPAILRRGQLSVEAEVTATTTGVDGLTPAGAVTVIHRPIFGVEAVTNPGPMAFPAAGESDEALRRRIRRGHPGSGGATFDALLAAVTALPGVHERDVRLAADAVTRPGVIEASVAVPVDLQDRVREALEAARPAGVRLQLDFAGVEDATVDLRLDRAALFGRAPRLAYGVATGAGTLPLDLEILVEPSVPLAPAERSGLGQRVEAAVRAVFDDLGFGARVVHSRLVAAVALLEQVADVKVQILQPGDAERIAAGALDPAARMTDVVPARPDLRPVLGRLTIESGGELVLLDVGVDLELLGAGTDGDVEVKRTAAVSHVRSMLRRGELGARLRARGVDLLTPEGLRQLLAGEEGFEVTRVTYTAHFLDAGVRVLRSDLPLELGTGLGSVWVGAVRDLAGTATGAAA
ncbi:MAG: baseplate J/gp47 family protein [Acidobacteriota bacterium]